MIPGGYPELCCTREAVVRALLKLHRAEPRAFFSLGIILPRSKKEGPRGARERRRRELRLQALGALLERGVIEEGLELEGIYRLEEGARRHYGELYAMLPADEREQPREKEPQP